MRIGVSPLRSGRWPAHCASVFRANSTKSDLQEMKQAWIHDRRDGVVYPAANALKAWRAHGSSFPAMRRDSDDDKCYM